MYNGTITQHHITAGEMARLIDSETVEVEIAGHLIELTADVPDWNAR